jgi:hypothetical protein
VSGISSKSCATGVGSILLQLANGMRLKLQDALYVPGMADTLVLSARLFSTIKFCSIFGAQNLVLNCAHHVVASATRQTNSPDKLDGRIVMCTPSPPCPLAGVA